MDFSNCKDKKIGEKTGILILIVFAVFALGAVFFFLNQRMENNISRFSSEGGSLISEDNPAQSRDSQKAEGIKKFSGEEEFKAYLLSSSLNDYYSVVNLGMNAKTLDAAEESAPSPLTASGMGESVAPQFSSAQRVSQTNVQTVGIDEPDIIKTDGKEIYYSSEPSYYRYAEGTTNDIAMPYNPSYGQTRLINAFPAENIFLDGEISKNGNLLLQDGTLMIFSNNSVSAYNVKDPKNPQSLWDLKLEKQNYLEEARLYNGKVYLVSRSVINEINPCPIKPLTWGEGESLTIACSQIYHPEIPSQIDSVYSAMIINPQNGTIEKNISFTGSSGSSVVYMSGENIYITYSQNESPIDFFYQFLIQKAQDLFPASVLEKIVKIQGYDISSQSKMIELNIIFEKYLASLDDDEQLRIENEVQNRMGDFYKEKIREIEKTGIVKIGLDNFEISASGIVPGSLLNQFSLDEYEENLRVAVTSGQNRFWWGFSSFSSGGSTANDVYILNSGLEEIGSVLDISKEWQDETIYAVRFLQDRGYIVTFRETDPLTVLDLSSPQNPKIAGQLEIPGYSSYLHPLASGKILGIGKEDFKVKISLFDVSNAENPKETAKYTLDEYWSEAVENHHAFLQDENNQIFFLPGSKGGYVFSYGGGQLKLVKAVSGIQVKRAVYLNNYLYVAGANGIAVFDETNWKKIKEITFK
ncbi:MAG: beta-propeller domain-containing protein [Candidatus Pacebacteria bacterium]|nr:beta-propeller domain-containing protein [Candidatus Paceibacterota bacterium]MDD4830757.1 beta-propeller domain-containing protein [Candidatus Paceibacterota bacterium]MDD4874855.1 beta-propeller domain-containing protein [Candidatus Paceibacterota bacterium]